MPKTVILSPPAPRSASSAAASPASTPPTWAARRSRPRSSAPSVEPEQVQHVVMGQVLQAGQGQIPSRQAQIKARHPEGGPLRDDQQGVRVGHPRRRACSTTRSAPATSRSASAAAWSRCRSAPYLLPGARFGFRMGDAKAIDAMINDGLTNPFSGKHMAQEASEVADRARADPPRHGPLGAALARARDQGHRRGPPARGDRAGHGQVQEGRHRRRDRRGAAPRHARSRRSPSCRRSSSRTARTPPATRRA